MEKKYQVMISATVVVKGDDFSGAISQAGWGFKYGFSEEVRALSVMVLGEDREEEKKETAAELAVRAILQPKPEPQKEEPEPPAEPEPVPVASAPDPFPDDEIPF